MTLRTKTLTAVAALTIFAGGYSLAQDTATTEQPAEAQQPAADAGASTETPAEDTQADAGATETEAAEEPAAEADEAGAEEPADEAAEAEDAPAEAEATESEPAEEPAAEPADAADEPADATDDPAADAEEAPADEAAADEAPAEDDATESESEAEPADAEAEEPAAGAAATEEAPAEDEATEDEPVEEAADAAEDESAAEEESADEAAAEEASAEEGAAEEAADHEDGAAEEEHAESGDGHGGHVEDISFSFEGPFGKYDQFQLQRGLQVYTEVCAACHGLKFVPLRTLSDDGGPGLPEDQVRAYAAEMTIIDEETDEERPRLPTDHFPENNDAGAPDLSLMAKARAGFHGPQGTGINQLVKGIGGPEYIHALLVGYTGEEQEQAGTVLYENTAFPGGYISMTPPLSDDLVTYEDGTEATVDQMARDVSAFLMWTAEPKMSARKEVGLTSVLFLIVLASLLYLTNKKIWAPHKGKLKD